MKPQKVVDDLNPTENGEAGEETHRASDQAKLGLRCHLGGEIMEQNFNLEIYKSCPFVSPCNVQFANLLY